MYDVKVKMDKCIEYIRMFYKLQCFIVLNVCCKICIILLYIVLYIVYKSVVQVTLYYCIECMLYKLQCIVVYNVCCTSYSVLLCRMYVVQSEFIIV